MTALDSTCPQPITRSSARHEHGWRVESSHATSEGRVLYVRCDDCGARRVDLADTPHAAWRALTTPMPRR